MSKDINKINYKWQNIAILMLLAYIFSFAVRMIWVYQFSDIAQFHWMNKLMINTNDGYFFASMVQKIIDNMHRYNPRVLDGWRYAMVALTVILHKVTPFSLATIMLYLPAVISSLVVIPIILIGKLYKNLPLGFFSALLGSVAWSYYNRTMAGYYDTDMFSAMAPMFILYFLSATIETEKSIYSILSAVSILIYPFLYDQGLSLVYAMSLFYMLYMIIFHNKDRFTYQSIILISVALLGINPYIKAALVLIIYLGFKKYILKHKQLIILAILTTLAFLITGNVFSLIYGKLVGYIVRGTEESGLHFFQVAQTVREAGKISFDVMADRISGSVLGVLIAFIGYVVLVVRHKSFILSLPLMAIGVFSLWGGLRFTVYAVPVAALGAVFLIYILVEYIKDIKLRYLLMSLAVLALLYPNIIHIIGYRVPSVLNRNEVQDLNKLKHIGSSKDYVITWWDFGYPIWFYTDKNTLIDGGKHNHDNYIVSKILTTSSQKEAALLSRLAVETYVDSGYKGIADTIFHNYKSNQVDAENFFDELDADTLKIPKATRDIYLYLPFKMLDIFPTIKLFSNINLDTGEKISSSFIYQTRVSKPVNDDVDFGNGVMFNTKSGNIKLGTRSVPVFQVVNVGTDMDGKTRVNIQDVHRDGALIILVLKNYERILILDKNMYYSTFIQMFFLENYDHNLFEPVILSPYSKIYRVKA